DRERDGSIELMYHFVTGAAVLTLHVWVTYTNPGVPSVANQIPSAVLYELEVAEMFGVKFRNLPTDKEHLLLPDDWPQNVYPLRKSFTGLKETAKN
ncbi:MAG: NADH-quinone oxidoreductase subunit C, partial [Anaerolineaceae bacterium]